MANISISITFVLTTLILAVTSYQQTAITHVNAHSPLDLKLGRFNVLNSKRTILEGFHPIDRKRTARQATDEHDEGLGRDVNENVISMELGSGNKESTDESFLRLVPGLSYNSENILPSRSTYSGNDVLTEDESSDNKVDDNLRTENTDTRSSDSFVALSEWEDVKDEPIIVIDESQTEGDKGQPSVNIEVPENNDIHATPEDVQWDFGSYAVENKNAEDTDETKEKTAEYEDRELQYQMKGGSEKSSSEQDYGNSASDFEDQDTDRDIQYNPANSEDRDESAQAKEEDATTVSPNEREESITSTATPRSSPSGLKHLILNFMRENVYIIVGFILGVPAAVLLVYVLNVKRLRRHTGRLKVTPSSHKKRPIDNYPQSDSSNQTLVTEENELAQSPTGKTPRPPTFPLEKSFYS